MMRLPVLLLVLAMIAGCARPTRDQDTLQAIKAESSSLLKAYPPSQDGWTDVRKSEWPPAIARLRPHSVTVRPYGVDIVIKPGMDGGLGYEIPRSGSTNDLPMPAQCYTDLGQGVFWHGPC